MKAIFRFILCSREHQVTTAQKLKYEVGILKRENKSGQQRPHHLSVRFSRL